MTDTTGKMSCEEFQAQLPELIGAGERASELEHIQTCELCRALLADLETIAEAARQLFPIVEPPDNLWEQIESKIKSQSDGASGKKLGSRLESGMAAQPE
jgi:hypothetical protein